MSREAMQMALEALESDPISHAGLVSRKQAITALRERLAQPEQEPIATVESVATVVSESGNQEITMSWWHEPALPVGTKLYTAPPKRELTCVCGAVWEGEMMVHQPRKREWVGLTDEKMRECAQAMDAEPLAEGWTELIKFARAIEAKLREKNHG